MKKIIWTGAILGVLFLSLVGFVALTAFVSSSENTLREQAYAEGQYDAITGSVSYTRLVTDADSDVDKGRKLAYTQGLEDTFDGDVRIKKVTDSTYVWTKSPWDTESKIPTNTIIIKK